MVEVICSRSLTVHRNHQENIIRLFEEMIGSTIWNELKPPWKRPGGIYTKAKRNGFSIHEKLAEIVQYRDDIVIVPPIKRIKFDVPIANILE